jgi:hypothetical protein
MIIPGSKVVAHYQSCSMISDRIGFAIAPLLGETGFLPVEPKAALRPLSPWATLRLKPLIHANGNIEMELQSSLSQTASLPTTRQKWSG